MTWDKSCPGSRAIREPKPEYMNCPNCGNELEIWTDELKATCRKCGGKVLRAQQASCIEWCSHAKECVGPEVYERLMAGGEDEVNEGESPLEVLKKEHDRAQDKISLLRAAGLCLKLGAATEGTPIWGKGIEHLGKVIEFIDRDIRLHFKREEDVLFPIMNNHLASEKSPVRLLLGEHADIWRLVDELKEQLAELEGTAERPDETLAARVNETSNRVESLLREHIKKENDSLLPLAKRLLNESELMDFTDRWKTVSLETGAAKV